MGTILLGAAVGLFVLISRIYEQKKKSGLLEKTLGENKWEIYDFSNTTTILLAVMAIPSAICAILGYIQNEDTTTALGVILIFLFISEAINAKHLLKLYYNNSGCVLNEKYVRYKSMKSIKKKNNLPFSKYILETFSNERIIVSPKAALKIIELSDVKQIEDNK